MIPFWNSARGGAQLTRMLVELGLEHVTSCGGAEGSDWPGLRKYGLFGGCDWLVRCLVEDGDRKEKKGDKKKHKMKIKV